MYVSILYRKAFNYNNEIVDDCEMMGVNLGDNT